MEKVMVNFISQPSQLQETEPHQNEVPQSDGAGSKESAGYFKLSHSVFQNPVLQTLPGDAFRLFLWMSSIAWRFKHSDGLIRASISYITQGTGISSASASRALVKL